MQYRWNIRQLNQAEEALTQKLSTELNIAPLSARLLVVRGIKTKEEAHNFVHPSLSQLHDPFLMKDMDKACNRLTSAIQRNERILIYGDYDVDGTTAVALVYKFLLTQHQQLFFYIPDRYKEGYGISTQGIDYAHQNQCTLIIALDCGIKANTAVQYANQKGIDFIICDHHTPAESIPNAIAVLDPKRKDCPYPYKELSGCGVGFKLMQAYCIKHNLPQDTLLQQLELLALSIASDIVPITGENRILAYFGLKQLNLKPSVGLKTIMQLADLNGKEVTISDLVYRIGPRINACGRMKSGAEAVQLLITDDETNAVQKGQEINQYNAQRKEWDQKITTQALQQIEADPDFASKHTTVVYAPNWNKGVVGIVASRLTEHYYRPTIVLTDSGNNDGIITGSARSAGGFDLYAAIDSCSNLLTNFGGHVFAAGLSMKAENLTLFKERFDNYVTQHILPEQQLPLINIESQISFGDINTQFYNIIAHLEPFGPDNPYPLFVTRHTQNYRYTRRVGKTGEHLRLDLKDNTGYMQGIAFYKGDLTPDILQGKPVDVCYRIEKNTYNGNTTLQMMVQDIKFTEEN